MKREVKANNSAWILINNENKFPVARLPVHVNSEKYF